MLKELDMNVMEETAGGTCFYEPGQLVIDTFHWLDNNILYPILGAVLTPITTIGKLTGGCGTTTPTVPTCPTPTRPTTPTCPTRPTTPTCPTTPTTPTIPS